MTGRRQPNNGVERTAGSHSLASTLIAAVVATGLSIGTGPRVEAQSPLRIGASLSQTGSYAALGQSQLRGYQLCVKHANEKGGVLGRRIELYVEDDQSNAATAVAIYEVLGRTAEFVYGSSEWEPEVVTLRTGGLIPIARQDPGASEFVESYRKEFPGADLPLGRPPVTRAARSCWRPSSAPAPWRARRCGTSS